MARTLGPGPEGTAPARRVPPRQGRRDAGTARPPSIPMRGPPVRSPPRLVPPRAAAAEAPESPSCALRVAMAASSARPAALVMPALALLLLLCVGPGKGAMPGRRGEAR